MKVAVEKLIHINDSGFNIVGREREREKERERERERKRERERERYCKGRRGIGRGGGAER